MSKKQKHYVNNTDFLTALIDYKERCAKAKKEKKEDPAIPNYVGECFLKIAEHLSRKPNFVSYSFRDEMIADGIENCFHTDTKILTIEHGPIEIGKLVNESVTIKSRDGIWRKATVRSYGKQMLYEYGFGARNKRQENINQKVICTENHRWFVRSRLNDKKMFAWKNETIQDLRIGDMLENSKFVTEKDNNAIIHGLLFGDGSVTTKTKTTYNDSLIVQQGRDYAFMRVCKQDYVKDEIIELLNTAGYKCTYPKSAKGDPVYYFGRFPYCKDVPFTYDPSYIAGFIHGWWLADGTKKTRDGMCVISTADANAANWLVENCAYAGYHVLSHRIKPRDSSGYTNGLSLHIISLGHDDYYKPRVKYVKEYGEEEVFCLEEPATGGFVLANGLLTGNCIQYFRNFDETKSKNPFAYFTQIIYFAFLRRIQKEKKQLYVKYKATQQFGMLDEGEMYEDENGHMKQFELYDNIAEFIDTFEQAKENKKKVKTKGLEKFLEAEEIIEIPKDL